MFEKHWKIGELARATGLTVRTLHHYDVIGLLVPSERTQAGYRLYGEHDVRRLYEIRALRDLGIPLGEIPDALDGDVRDTIGRHLERVEHELEQSRRLRSLLQRILDADTEASSHDYMEAIEAMTMFEKYYTPEQLDRIEELVQAGRDEGAEIYQPPCRLPEKGYWFAPTVFTNVAQSYRIAQEEIFGPVLSILTFRTPEEAVEKANNTPYGLSAGVWTEKGSRILWMAERLRAGVVWANTYNRFDPASPFGGYKESGFGREGGLHGLEPYLAFD